MNRLIRPAIMLIIGLLLAIFVAALTHSVSTQSSVLEKNTNAAFFFQSTSTPEPQDNSEIGSTDGIVAMGFAITLIVIVPILLRRKSWMQSQ